MKWENLRHFEEKAVALQCIPPQEVASTARVAHENHTLHMELNLQKHANSNLMQQLNDSQLALAMKEQELEVCVGVGGQDRGVVGRGHTGQQGVPTHRCKYDRGVICALPFWHWGSL